MRPAISSIISSTVNSELEFAGTPLTLRVSPRARRLRLRIDPRTRSVLLTVPKRTPKHQALAWAAGHREWIETQLAEIPDCEPIAPGAQIPFRGETLTVDWQEKRPRRIEIAGDRLIVGGPMESLEPRVLRWLRAEALDILSSETSALATVAGARLSGVGVGDPVSRWGSCSSSHAIRYSWRLILAPDFVRKATVAHEVAHLIHLNHGRQFHELVERLLGEDPAPARAWLRREGAALHRIGRRG